MEPCWVKYVTGMSLAYPHFCLLSLVTVYRQNVISLIPDVHNALTLLLPCLPLHNKLYLF